MGAPLPGHLRPEAAPVNGARRQVSPVRRLGICIIYARGGPPPAPPPSRSVPVITAGQSAASRVPGSRLPAKPAGSLQAVKTEAGAAAISGGGTLLRGRAGRPSLGWDGGGARAGKCERLGDLQKPGAIWDLGFASSLRLLSGRVTLDK